VREGEMVSTKIANNIYKKNNEITFKGTLSSVRGWIETTDELKHVDQLFQKRFKPFFFIRH
jgi:hypothetical protein